MQSPYIIGLKVRQNRILKEAKSIFQKRLGAKKHESRAGEDEMQS